MTPAVNDRGTTMKEWTVKHRTDGRAHRTLIYGPGGIIADCDWGTPAENLDNATLLAAAPRLQSLLKESVACLAHCALRLPADSMLRAEAGAIASAVRELTAELERGQV
jgi:hypothetical protein